MGFKLWGFREKLASADVNAYLMNQANIVCTSGARPSTPVDGMEIFETDTRRKLRYSTSDGWLMWPPTATEVTDPTNFTTTSTVFSAGATNCEITFSGPPTGRVMIACAGQLSNSGAGQTSRLSWELRAGSVSGSIVQAADINNAVTQQGVEVVQASSPWKLVTGLTAGATYYIRTMHSVGSGTATITMRRLSILPLPN